MWRSNTQCIECYVCRDCRYTDVCGSYTTPYTEYYEVWKFYSTLYKVAFRLNIQPIFNLQKVLESWDWGLFNHTINTIYVDTVNTGQGSLMHSMLSTSTLSIQTTSTHFAHNFLNIQPIFNLQKVLESWDWGLFKHTFNTIYVDTVDTGQGSLMHSMLSMLTLSIQNTSTHFCP